METQDILALYNRNSRENDCLGCKIRRVIKYNILVI